MSQPVPILLLSDSPDLPSGLARITRDLAFHLSNDLPQHFRVGTLGRSGNGSAKLPWAQYNFAPTDGAEWGENSIARAWEDFAGTQRGIIMTIQDPSRVYWFSHGEAFDGTTLGRFLCSGQFKKWGYFPIDSTGPGDKLTGLCAEAVRPYDRVLAYTDFGSSVLKRSINRPVEWIPHGIDMEVFRPRDRAAARLAAGWKSDHFVLGTVMTNQPRKDWGLAANICSQVRKWMPCARFWWHVDTLTRHWSIRALIEDYGLADVVKVTIDGTWTDEELAYWYSACDMTMLPSLCEGFGYPIVESMACGVPCVHGSYGGGAGLIPEQWRVDPQSWRLDTPYNVVRPSFDSSEWTNRILELCSPESSINHWSATACRSLVEHLHWPNLWKSCWKKWFMEGLC